MNVLSGILIGLTILLGLHALPATAAITADASNSAQVASATSLTYSLTTTTASNRLIVVGVLTVGTTDRVTGVTYGGAALTRIDTVVPTSGNRIYLYYLLAPATGANDVVVSLSSSAQIISAAATFSDVHQSGQPTQQITCSNDAATSLSCTNTTTVDNSLHIGEFAGFDFVASAGAGTTQIAAISGGGLYKSTALVTPPGSNSVTITTGGTDKLAGVSAVFKPFAAAAAAAVKPPDIIQSE